MIRNGSINDVTIVGNLTVIPELKAWPDGTPTVAISVATDRSYTDKQTQQKVEKAEFVSCNVNGPTAEYIARNWMKGDKVGLKGYLKTDITEKNGIKQYYTKVVIEGATLMGRSEANRQYLASQQQPAQQPYQAAPQQPMAPQGGGYGHHRK